jgi:hypothetical protein
MLDPHRRTAAEEILHALIDYRTQLTARGTLERTCRLCMACQDLIGHWLYDDALLGTSYQDGTGMPRVLGFEVLTSEPCVMHQALGI